MVEPDLDDGHTSGNAGVASGAPLNLEGRVAKPEEEARLAILAKPLSAELNEPKPDGARLGAEVELVEAGAALPNALGEAGGRRPEVEADEAGGERRDARAVAIAEPDPDGGNTSLLYPARLGSAEANEPKPDGARLGAEVEVEIVEADAALLNALGEAGGSRPEVEAIIVEPRADNAEGHGDVDEAGGES